MARTELVATLEAMLRRTVYDTKLQEYFSLAARKAALEVEHDHEVLADHSEYHALSNRCDHLRDDLDALLADSLGVRPLP